MSQMQMTPSASTSILPTEVKSLKQSLKFVKKLLAIGISTIAYLRFNIPEEVHFQRSL
jgi:hypothetical protein